MRESGFKLSDKTIVLSGHLSPLTQGIIHVLAEHGADVGFVTQASNESRRFMENINDVREVHARHGRGLVVDAQVTDLASAQEAIGRVAESFGGIDALIDARMLRSLNAKMEEAMIEWKQAQLMAEAGLPFLKGRQRGHILILAHDEALTSGKEIQSEMARFVSETARSVFEKGITMNGVCLGLTEDVLMQQTQNGLTIQQALEQFRKEKPWARIIEPTEIAHFIAYLVSPLNSAVSGQMLIANAGL